MVTNNVIPRHMVQRAMQWWLSFQTEDIQYLATHHCWYCGACDEAPWHYTFVYDHAFPKTYDDTPLVWCCLQCNSSKGTKTPPQFQRRWYMKVTLKESPLACALQEDYTGFEKMYNRLRARHVRERNGTEKSAAVRVD
jgi:5-methylcytosine-specific restriction endonuclease McrA